MSKLEKKDIEGFISVLQNSKKKEVVGIDFAEYWQNVTKGNLEPTEAFISLLLSKGNFVEAMSILLRDELKEASIFDLLTPLGKDTLFRDESPCLKLISFSWFKFEGRDFLQNILSPFEKLATIPFSVEVQIGSFVYCKINPSQLDESGASSIVKRNIKIILSVLEEFIHKLLSSADKIPKYDFLYLTRDCTWT